MRLCAGQQLDDDRVIGRRGEHRVGLTAQCFELREQIDGRVDDRQPQQRATAGDFACVQLPAMHDLDVHDLATAGQAHDHRRVAAHRVARLEQSCHQLAVELLGLRLRQPNAPTSTAMVAGRASRIAAARRSIRAHRSRPHPSVR